MNAHAYVTKAFFFGGLALTVICNANFLNLPWMNRVGYSYFGIGLGMMLERWMTKRER